MNGIRGLFESPVNCVKNHTPDRKTSNAFDLYLCSQYVEAALRRIVSLSRMPVACRAPMC